MAGWNPFKRKARAKATEAANGAPPAPVQPLVREAHRPARVQDNLPRFHSSASDQLSGRGIDRFNLIRAKLRDAYTPSQPVADRRLLAGREDVMKTIIRAIEDQRLHVVIYGERGIGKTSLMHVLTQAARDARYIVVYASCGSNSNFDETFRGAAADIPLLFHSGFSPTASEAERGSSLADLVPKEPLTPRKFGDLCAKLTGTRVLIILDEFDRAESGAFRRDVAELIKSLSDRLGRVQLVLAGVASDLTELVEHVPSIRRNIFALRIPKMSEGEVLQIVANGEREATIKFDGSASAFVVEVSLGSPYIANLICHHAAISALDDARATVTPGDVQTAVERAILEFRGRVPRPVQQAVGRLFDSGRHEALALAARTALSGDGPFSATDLAAIGKMTNKQAEDVIELVTREGLLRQIHSEEGAVRVQFVEDGLPPLIWMMWALHNLSREPAAAIAASAS